MGLVSNRIPPHRILLAATVLMAGTGVGFAALSDLWPLLVVAFVGTLNPTGGDVSVFLPVEQSLLSSKVDPAERTALFARYNLGGVFAGALGALASAIPELVAHSAGWDVLALERAAFLLYGAVGVLIALIYLPMRTPAVVPSSGGPLRESRGVILRLSAIFSIDSLGGGFVVQALLVLWLHQRFDLSTGVVATVFFVAGLLSAFSQLAASWLSSRIGLIQTMVYTHLPANVFLIVAALMPAAPLAITFLLLRTALAQMDVPARQSYVMAIVPPAERAAAASVTNVPRSLASAFAPLIAGALLSRTTFGWPLIIGGVLKILYDLLLLARFRSVPTLDTR